MRIGLFTDTYTPDINGVVSSIITLQKELEKNGHDVYVITNHKAARMKKEGNVLRLPGLELKWLYGYKLSTPYHFSAQEEIRKMNLDIIHVHTEFGVGMFGRIVAKYLNIPVVTTYHTMYEDYTHYINRFELDEVDKVSKKMISTFSRVVSDSAQAVISPSEKTKETLLKYGVKTPIYVIPTGLNFDKFNRDHLDPVQIDEIKKQYGIQPDDHVIVFVGRIAPEKSIDIPIEGFRYIDDPKIKLMIVGGGPQLDELKKMVKTYHLEQQVIFTDKKTRDEVPLYYACADCFVSASLTETQGMTYIEALACQLPVFARPDDVLKDLVIEGKTGYLFQTPQEFAKKLVDFFALPQDVRDEFKERARAKIIKYDSRVFYSKVIATYYQAIDDYQDAYEVVRIKAMDDYVKIYVENDKEDQPIKILISLEDYFMYKIRLHTLLDRYTVAEFQHKEILLEAYRSAIRKLRMKDYTSKEMRVYLNRTPGLAPDEVDRMIKELEEKGYLNDYRYVSEKLDSVQYALTGKGKIERIMKQKGVSDDVIDQVLETYDDSLEIDKARKMAEKLMVTVKDKSLDMKKKTMIHKLILQGFERSIAKESVEALDFSDYDDADALEKTIQKGIRNYARRYQGSQLKTKVFAYCIQKGFHHEDIKAKLEEMEWHNE